MRRLAHITIVSLILLSACRRAGSLAPEDVLRRATTLSGQLQSAKYDIGLDVAIQKKGLGVQGNAAVHGSIAHGGQQAAFSVETHGVFRRDRASTRFDVAADAVVDIDDVYLLLRSASVDPAPAVLQNIDAMLGVWWKFPRAGGTPQPLTPDPQFLRAQAAVVRVQQDHGLEDVDGKDAYHYTVAIDPDRLIALLKASSESRGAAFDTEKIRADIRQYDATGELWIDAESFAVVRLSWKIVSKDEPRSVDLALRADVHPTDDIPSITIPATSKPFDGAGFLQQILSISSSGALRFSP